MISYDCRPAFAATRYLSAPPCLETIRRRFSNADRPAGAQNGGVLKPRLRAIQRQCPHRESTLWSSRSSDTRSQLATKPPFEEAYRNAGELLEASSHCLGFSLMRATRERQRYRDDDLLGFSPDGHLIGFRQSPAFKTIPGTPGSIRIRLPRRTHTTERPGSS